MLRFRLTNRREYQEFQHLAGPIEFGRAGARENIPRCIIQDEYVSQNHIRIVELEGGRIRVENLSKRNSIRLPEGEAIAISETRELPTPIRLLVGQTTLDIDIEEETYPEGPFQTIASPISHRSRPGAQQSLLELGRSPTPETLARWFETLITIQHAAAGSPEFYEQTARAVVELVGLDRGLVLLRKLGRWMVQARYPEEPAPGREFSLTMLDRVERETRTFFQSVPATPMSPESLQGVEAVVASPILDPHGQMVGAVYGCRTRLTAHAGPGIGPLEAQVVQLLAATVGVGLARQEQEARALRSRLQFEQFFGEDLARELERDPRMLAGQEREITVLFSDIRSFSSLAGRLGPTDTCKLVSDVMERLTACVRAQGGSVVAYIGDGMMAMWNAPRDDPGHAARACRAALNMLSELPRLDAEWRERLGRPLRLGIGLNTGRALCGNIGTAQKFHYGPLGDAVNLASRVEASTKHLGAPLLISASTREQVGNGFATRRLCRARLLGIEKPVDLFELHAEESVPGWQVRQEAYEAALALYEQGNWEGARRALARLSNSGEPDVPAENLLARTAEAIRTPPEPCNGAFVFDLTRLQK
jgi:adenylate cyclase